MFQVVTTWNLVDPTNDTDLNKHIKDIKLRGYNSETFLTGQLANKIGDKEISPLSVSDIADKYCPIRRDLYFRKGKNRSYRRKQRKSWGGTAGRITQSYIFDIFSTYLKHKDAKKYANIVKTTNKFLRGFKNTHNKNIKSLGSLAKKEYEDPERLLKLLTFNGRVELGMKLMHSILSKNGRSIDCKDIAFERQDSPIKICSDPIQIGMSPSTPDFLIEKYGVVGDIKSGVNFEDHYLLTCAGYALVYENWKRKNQRNINWGIISFFPTRIPTDYAKPFTFAQIYIFPIDDILRKWFLDERDYAYKTIIQDSPLDFPENKQHCEYCRYIEDCKKMGLVI